MPSRNAIIPPPLHRQPCFTWFRLFLTLLCKLLLHSAWHFVDVYLCYLFASGSLTSRMLGINNNFVTNITSVTFATNFTVPCSALNAAPIHSYFFKFLHIPFSLLHVRVYFLCQLCLQCGRLPCAWRPVRWVRTTERQKWKISVNGWNSVYLTCMKLQECFFFEFFFYRNIY